MRWPAFSTLACPDWSLERTLESGRGYGYAGVELRLVDGELIDASMPAGDRRRIGRLLAGSGLELVTVDSSIRLTEASPAGQVAGRLEAFLQLAAGWRAPLVRVFGGDGEPGQATEVLNLVAPAADSLGVSIGVETHDAFSSATVLAGILSGVASPRVGVIWDVLHTHRSGESPAHVMAQVGRRLLGVHVKDARRQGDGWRLVLLGQGEVPVRECLAELRRAGYPGWIVAEWEKRWHPEIEEPEVALPQHARVLQGWLGGGPTVTA